MNACPNFNDEKYKFLEAKLGELEAYKYWHKNNGDLSNVLTEDERKELIEKAKGLVSKSLGLYEDIFLEKTEEVLKEFVDQLNSSESEARTARKMLGPELTRIAFQLYPKDISKQDEPRTIGSGVVAGILQSQGMLGKRIANGIYESRLQPDQNNPIDQQVAVYKAAQRINAELGKEAVSGGISPNGKMIIAFRDDLAKVIGELNSKDVDTYKQFLNDNLYTNKENPVTTEIVNNAAKLAQQLGRQDLINIARMLNKYLDKNPTMSVRILSVLDEDAKAYYSRVSNRITFGRDKIGTNSLEFETLTTLHEVLHGLTFQPWEKNKILNEDEKVFKGVVEGYYNYFKSLKGANLKNHAFKDPEEFLMGALMDNVFKDHLKSIGESPVTRENAFTRFMKDLIKGFLRLFGIGIEPETIEKLDPTKFEADIFDGLSEYLDKMGKIGLWNGLKEQGRNYGLSFQVTAEGDYNAERIKMKTSFMSDENKAQVKKVIEKSILAIKSFGSSIRTRLPESQEGFKAIFRQLKKMENPDYNMDQIDFFFDFTSEIGAIMNMADEKITKLQTDQTNIDPDSKLKEYESIVSAIRNFDSIISDIESVKLKLENLGLNASAKDINTMLVKRSRIEKVYSMGVFPLVTSKMVDILEPSSKKAITIANEKIDELNKRIGVATKANNKSRITQLTNELNREQEKINREFTINSDKVESWLRGEMGDSNMFTTWLLAGISNSNPIAAGLSKFLRDNIGEIAPRVLQLQNDIQTHIESYQRDTGRNDNNTTNFNSPMIQIHTELTQGRDKDGNFNKKQVYSLLHQFNNEHIEELQKFKRSLVDLTSRKRDIENDPNKNQTEVTDLLKKINEVRNNRRQFLKDYMEQQYASEVHDALEMLHEDLGGYTAWDYMGPIISRIEDTNLAIDQSNDESRTADLYNQLDDYNFELRRLSSLYEKSKDSREYVVAQQLKKRNELLTKFSNFNLTEKGKLHFEAEKARMTRRLDKGEISKERFERWLEDNTVTELTPKYWDDKKNILDSLNSILTKLGAKTDQNEEIKGLYKGIEDITKAHRDSNGIINGQQMSDKELKDVKDLEEKIERAKDKIANIMGLTRAERIELANLNEQFIEITEAMLRVTNPAVQADLEDTKSMIENRIMQIESGKKKLDKILLDQYFKIMKKLSELDETIDTKYYNDELTEQTEKAKWTVDLSGMKNRFFANGKTYILTKDKWSEIDQNGSTEKDKSYVEDVYRTKQGSIALSASDWWKNNHITRMKFVKNEAFDLNNPQSRTGEWSEQEDPIYAWRQTRPRDPSYVNTGNPSIKYKKREIKEQYVNKNYREDVSGNIQPKTSGYKDDRFINKDYKRLSSSNSSIDKGTFKMLNFLTDLYLKSQQSIPVPWRKGYKLPSIRKSAIERLFSKSPTENTQSFFEHLGQLSRFWKDDVATNVQDKDILTGYADDMFGIVPMKFLGEIDAKDQSIDLPRIIQIFVAEAIKREQLVKSLPLANALKDITNSKEYYPVKTKRGLIDTVKTKFLPKGTELAKRSQVSNTALQVNEIIKSEIYGENMKDQQGAKLVQNTLAMGAKVLLGFNFISSVQNYVNAFTQSMMETESKNSRNFNMKDFFKAQKMYYAHVDELMSDVGKYGNKSYLNQFFDYFGGINYKLFSKNNKSLSHAGLREFVGNLSLPNTITEHMLNYHMGIAIALNYRVNAKIDGKDTMIPIIEAFTLKDRNLEIKPGVEVTENDRKEMISRLNSSARRINGEYGDRILADKYILGKLALFMNRYTIPFIVKRYGARKFDLQDGVRDEGYWRTFGKLIIKDIKAKSIPIIMGWKYYSKDEKVAILKASTEFGFTVMFYLLMNALGGSDNKHLQDNSVLANDLIYALKGIQQQNEAFMPIPGVGFDDLLRKIQNPFPILGKIKNLVGLMQHSSQLLYYEMGLPGVDENDVIYTKPYGWHEAGDFKFFSDIEKLFGLPQRVHQYLHPDMAIKNLDAMSRIK